MKQILLVLTGGTIGSTVSDGIININNVSQFKLIKLLKQHYAKYQEFEFHLIQPVELLSENLVPNVWETIVNTITAQKLSQYDGIIITHGTDTLSYTASALSFSMLHVHLPILLVSSDYPLDDTKANGLRNFICALEFIRQIKEAGVFVPYQNQQQKMHVHWGTHLATCLPLSSDFISIQFKSYMQFENNEFSKLNHRSIPNKQIIDWSIKTQFSRRVLMVRPYPGLNYQHFDLSQVDAVLHDLYHSGTASVSTQWGDHYSLTTFIKRCNTLNIKTFLAPSIKSANAYQSTQVLIQQGAHIIWNMSIEAAYTKLLLAYGNFADEQTIVDFVDTNLAGETIEIH